MKSIVTAVILSLMSGSAFCQNINYSPNPNKVPDNVVSRKISLIEFERWMAPETASQLIDVRSADEFAEEHLENAINIDIYSPNFSDRVAALDRHKPTLVYCSTGKLSTAAARELIKNGFTVIYNLVGGISGWESAGMPVVQY